MEMRFGDSPSRPREVAPAPSTSASEAVNKPDMVQKAQDKGREETRSEGGDGETRKIASGAVARVRRKRQKEWRRRRNSDTDGEPDDVS